MKWAAAPEFLSGAPLRLTVWPKKGLGWSSSDELSALQTRVKDMEDKNIKLANVVQVMLVRRILPCQHRACNLWEFDPAKHQTPRELFGSSHKDIWKVLFKSGKSWPDSAEDRGYQLSRPASSVSHHTFYPHNPREMCVFHNSPRAGRRRRSGSTARPRCPKNRPTHF